jgi:hypothetical protein
MDNRLYFKQLEIGPMQNYVYLIGSMETRKVAVVDAAWEIDTILKIAAQDDGDQPRQDATHLTMWRALCECRDPGTEPSKCKPKRKRKPEGLARI